MKITVTFDSIEELLQTLNIKPEEVMLAVMHCGRGKVDVIPEQVSKAVPIKEAVDHAERSAAKEPAAKAAAPAEEKVEVDESFRVKVRHALAELNAQARRAGDGKKPAQDLIHSMGFDKLTDVPLDRLPELMEKAKEAADAAQ